MAEKIIKLGALGEFSAMDTETQTSTDPVDIEIKPDASCVLNVAIKKPSGAVLTVVLKYGVDGAEVPQVVSSSVTTATTVEVHNVAMAFGDELRVDIDGTSGDKKVSAKAVRLPRC